MGIYDADGKIRLTLAPGGSFVGLYAPDGSWYVTVAPGSSYVGSYAPDGSLYVSDATGSSTVGLRASDGSLRVTLNNENNGALKVSGITFGGGVSANAINWGSGANDNLEWGAGSELTWGT